MRAAGAKSAVVFCEELVWGTTPSFGGSVTPAAYGINFSGATLNMTKNLFQSETINQYRAIMGLTDGNKAVQGNIVTELLPEGLEIFYKHLLGKNPTTDKNPADATGSNPFTHIFKGYANTFPGLSIEKKFSDIDQYFLYKGCLINGMTLNVVQEGFHEITFDIIGKEEANSTSETITGAVYKTKDGFNGYQCVVSVDSGGGYVAVGNMTSGSISIQNNIETDGYVLGSALRASASFGRRECTGDFNLFFEDTTLYNVFTAGTQCAIKFAFTSGADSTTFEFPAAKLGGNSPDIPSFQGISLPLSFNAKYDSSTGTDVIITVVNSIATIPNE